MEVELTSHDSLLIVAYHLPLNVQRSAGGGFDVQWDDERGLNRDGMCAQLPKGMSVTYIGCIELDVTDLAEQEMIEKKLLEEFGCVVVFLDPAVKAKFYHGFCRRYLSPIMHNQMHVMQDVDPFQPDEWRAYCAANQQFAAKVMGAFDEASCPMIWIHDYHLLLLPSCLVRKLSPVVKIGFFLHAPFPSSDVWRTVAVRLELLRSLLNTDLVGFLMFEYTRNFLTCCKRMLALEYQFQKGGFLAVEYEGRHVTLQVSTFGISPAKVEERLHLLPPPEDLLTPEDDSTDSLGTVLRNGLYVIGAVDYLDRLKGVAPKLLAWEALLRDYPRYRTGYVLVQVCVGARNRIQIQTAGAVEEELQRIVDRINAAFPGAVHFQVRSYMPAAERLRLWRASQVYISTALRESINVHPHEYVLCRHLSRLAPGVLVLTEFTGFARVLNGCLRVNPNAQTELVETLDAALSMSSEERSARAAKDLLHIQKCTIEAFAQRFVTELKATANKSADDFMCVGFGLAKVRLVGMGAEFKPLDTSEVVGTFQRARRRLLLLDWGGTLAPPSSAGAIYDSRDSQGGAALPPTVIESLTRLCAQPGCHVVIVSGLPKERVLAAFGDVPNLSLAVEHGMHYRVGSGPWQQLVTGMDDSWRSVAHSVMNVYATRTHGAFVQTKGSSMLWNFVESDPEFGYMQGRELQTTLQHVLHNFPVVVRTGKGYVEACLKDVNKGALAQRIVETLTADGEPLDFTLCAGDDSSDELMFAKLHSLLGKDEPTLYTVTIGRKPSEANRYLDDHREMIELLDNLCSIGFCAPGSTLGSSGATGMGGGGAMGRKRGGFGGGSCTNLADLA